MNLLATFIFIFLFLPLNSLLIACADNQPDKSPKVSSFVSADGQPSEAKLTITIALPPEFNIFEQARRYQPVKQYLTETLKMDFQFKVVESYGAIIREIDQKRVQGAFLGSLSYLLARNRVDIEVIARPQWVDGSSSYTGLIFTRKNSGISPEVTTWKGKSLAIVHQATTAGYLFPQWYLLKSGVKDWNNFFNKTIMVGSHDATILMVINGEADLGVAKNTVFKQISKENPLVEQSLTILSESVEVPSNALVLRRDFPADLKEKIKEALLNMHSTASGKEKLARLGALKFMETTDHDYQSVAAMLRDIQLEASTIWFTIY